MSQTTQIDRQLPLGDEIFLDHVGHFVRDPQAAAAALVRAGFAPTPVSVQVAPDGGPTGTGNVCAMMTRGYLEVLFKTADTPLGREFEAALVRHSGVQLAAFAVADANAWHRRLGEAGFRTRPIAPFKRPVGTETGTDTASFTVARVEPGEMAEGRIQMLTHHTEGAVWQKRWLDHPNGARGLATLAIVVANVDEAAARYARFVSRPVVRTRGGAAVVLDRGRIDLVTRDAFAAALPEVDIPSLPFMAGYGVTMRLLDAVELALRSRGLASRRAGDVLVVPFPEELGQGTWLFSEDSQASVFG
ncbi:MAG: VOC family protein [Xanthobacteraceae bacterium]|nr:VOC family protein [Xanthobacteraceae bacterium]